MENEKIDPIVFLFGRIEDKFRKLVAEKYMEYKPDLGEVFDEMLQRMNMNLISKRKSEELVKHEICWTKGIRHESYENRFDTFMIYLFVDADLEEFSFHISNKVDSFRNNQKKEKSDESYFGFLLWTI